MQDRTPEQALREVEQTSGASKPSGKKLATADPKMQKGYESLGTIKFKVKGDNRGEGGA